MRNSVRAVARPLLAAGLLLLGPSPAAAQAGDAAVACVGSAIETWTAPARCGG